MTETEFHCAGMDARDVLNTIAAQGADLTRPRDAAFYFYGAEGKLPALQADLERLGFSVRPTKTEPGRIATINGIVDEAWLRQMMPKLCALTTALGVEYDGWEASIPDGHEKG